MKKKSYVDRIKNLLVAVVVVCGLCLIIGATRGLPASAQGLVTGRSDIAIDQLVERVGAQALTLAVIDAELVDAPPRPERNDGRRDRDQDRDRDRSISRNLDGALDDQLERIGPEIVYQVAVDAGLLTQAEAIRMLGQ